MQLIADAPGPSAFPLRLRGALPGDLGAETTAPTLAPHLTPGRPARGFLRICVVLLFACAFCVLAVRNSPLTRRRSWIGRGYRNLGRHH
ncbi:MAG: hypothetical protein MI923_21155 [Phycisphaerales bacterium]|nr:hypothetical protein [Phycisphaerales bacterium]